MRTQSPLYYKLPPETPDRSTLRKRRPFHDCRINYAKLKLIRTDGLHMISQGFSGYAFYIQQTTFSVQKAMTMEVIVREDCLVFSYMVEGTLSFKIARTSKTVTLPASRSCIQTIPKGTYKWDVEKGKMKGIYFILRPEWMLMMKSEYPELVETIEKLHTGKITYHAFVSQTISSTAIRQLRKMRDCKLTSRIELEELLLNAICKLVAEYHDYLAYPDQKIPKSNRQIVLEVRDHIIEEVGKGLIPQVSALSAWCNMEPKALLRNCKNTFNMTLQDLILDAQMKTGHTLLKKGMKVKDVAARLGYAEPSNFSRCYKKYFGYSPGGGYLTLEIVR